MTPGGLVAGWVFGSLVLGIAWCLACNMHDRLEERRWERDEHQVAEQLRLDRSAQRLAAFTFAVEEFEAAFDEAFPGLLDDEALDVYDSLEDLYELECAPDPKQRTG